MNLYYLHDKYADYGIMVAAHTAKEAKRLGYDKLSDGYQDYLDIRVDLMKHIQVPEDIVEVDIWDTCEQQEWMCRAWKFEWCCPKSCPMYNVRSQEESDDF